MKSARALVSLKVWGDYACFSRPEFKVERVTYPVMTPSAARGILEAIFWKPEFWYEIREIGILKPGGQLSILRNEVSEKQQLGRPFFVEEHRQQRMSLILKEVEYCIRAEIVLRPHATEPVFKYRDQFNRRVERGQCHYTPYLGTREFVAFFGPVDSEEPQPLDLDLGMMLFDIAYVEDPERPELEFVRHGPGGPRRVKGYALALFFPARLERGWLRVPREMYRELHRIEGVV